MLENARNQAVLIVDDQLTWRSLLSDVLEEEYEVTSAGSYEDALGLVTGHHPPFAAAIVDIRLDDTDPANEDGLRLLRWLKNLAVPTNAIVLTGYPSIRTAKEALKDLQAADYVLKYPEDGTPFDLKGLRIAVRQAVTSFAARGSHLCLCG
jgi:ActR/RegA family two-component response regulator